MQVLRKTGLLLLALLFATVSAADVFGAEPDKDKGERPRSNSGASKTALAGECHDYGSASAELDVNNVRARLFNNGNLFYNGSDPVYEVPKGSGKQSVFASSIWIGGYAGGELRMAAATYDNFEFRPGPLFADGSAPTNCAPYDRLWKVGKTDIEEYEATGTAPRDMAEWPWELGAPVVDGDGNPANYNLAGGDRPQVLGDQTIWWVMNDVSAPHDETETNPIGIEAQVTAFAYNQAGALGNTTFYKYKLTYRGAEPLTNAYLGLWSDADLGDGGDDYVGADTTLGLGFVYNGDNDDTGSLGYGAVPPALGYDFFQGPLVSEPGQTWTDPDGTVHQDATRLGMQRFIYYDNINDVPNGNPFIATDYYGYLTGFWKDGLPVTFGGNGRGFTETPVAIMYPADPPNFWSEENIDNRGTAIKAGDRRFVQSAGPFTMNPGDVQEIVFAIVWAQTDPNDPNPRHGSVRKLKEDDAAAQDVFDINFQLPAPPDAPRVATTPLDQSIILTWDYPRTSNNFLGSYTAVNPLISDVPDDTYDFEGFIVYQYESPSDPEGEVIAVFDKENGVTRITRELDGLVTVDVPGTDSGLQWSLQLQNLTNYTEYFFGVQAYAYNEFSSPRTYKSPIRRVMAVPSRVTARAGGTELLEESIGESPDTVMAVQRGQGVVGVRVVDPAQVTGATYKVEFKNVQVTDAEGHTADLTTYNIINEATGQKIFDGEEYTRRTGNAPPQGSNVLVLEGLAFDITGPAPGPLIMSGAEMFVEIAGPDPSYGCQAGSTLLGCREVGGDLVYASYNGARNYIMYAAGGAGPEESLAGFAPNDFEVRFTEKGSYALDIFATGNAYWVPFEVWDIGPTGAHGVNDPSDDVQLIATLFSDSGAPGSCAFGAGEAPGLFSGLETWTITDRIYAYYPVEDYAAFEAVAQPAVDAAEGRCHLAESDEFAVYDQLDALINYDLGRPIQRLVFNMQPDVPYPPAGVIVRFYTTKPNLPGDVFTFSTQQFQPVRNVDSLAVASIDDITIVPNPYKGASTYEVSRIIDVVRITNLPQRATIRIFNLAGTLVRTLEKSGPDTFINWDLQTENRLPIASGMYLVHVEAKRDDGSVIGEKIIKFGVVKKLIQLNEL